MVTDSAATPVIDIPVYAEVQHRPTAETGEQLQDTMFSTRCAHCHGAPAALGRSDADLYAKVCAMCHPEPQALVARGETLRTVIAEGDWANNMPAYARDAGGPLSDEQIESLVDYIDPEDE